VLRDQLFQLFAHYPATAFRAAAVDDHRESIDGLGIDEYRHLNEIARLVVLGLVAHRQPGSVAGKELFQYDNPPVIDIAVARAQSGFMHQLLQIDAELAVGSHDDVGTHADVPGHVSHRIFEFAIGRIVDDRHRALSSRRRDEFHRECLLFLFKGRPCRKAAEKDQCEAKKEPSSLWCRKTAPRGKHVRISSRY